MIRERNPLQEVDGNKRSPFKRVQPSRAAKTSHRWFSSRLEKSKTCESYCADRDSCSNLGCSYINDFSSKEKENCSTIRDK